MTPTYWCFEIQDIRCGFQDIWGKLNLSIFYTWLCGARPFIFKNNKKLNGEWNKVFYLTLEKAYVSADKFSIQRFVIEGPSPRLFFRTYPLINSFYLSVFYYNIKNAKRLFDYVDVPNSRKIFICEDEKN